jgi:hypothetical protein
MALVMVVSVVAVAAVLGYALLAATQLQAQAGGNVVRSAAADYLADSGVQLAMWHLQHTNGGWTGRSGISLGSSVPGTINVACQPLGNNTYQITSTATVNGSQHTAEAQVQLNYPVMITSASDSGLLGGLLNFIGGIVNGLLGNHSIALTNPSMLDRTWLQAHATELPCNLQDKVYGPADSPTGIFWTDGDAEIRNTVIRGMLVVYGDLKIKDTGSRITARTDQIVTGTWPAAVVVGGKVLPDDDSEAIIDGGLWVRDQIGDTPSGGGLLGGLLDGLLGGGGGGGGGEGSLLEVTGPVMVGSGGVTSDGAMTFRPLVNVLSWDPASH